MSEHTDPTTPDAAPDLEYGSESADPAVAAAYEPEASDAVVETADADDDAAADQSAGEAQAEAIQLYWESVRAKARIGRLAVYMGTDLSTAIAPPAWSFGDNPRLADELLGHVLSGRKTGTSTAMAEFGEDEPTPREGELSILLDSAGHPRALVRTTAVRVVRFDEVDEEFAASEGEDDLSLGSWREQHEIYWRRVLGDDAFDPAMEVLTERFEVLDPRPGREGQD